MYKKISRYRSYYGWLMQIYTIKIIAIARKVNYAINCRQFVLLN